MQKTLLLSTLILLAGACMAQSDSSAFNNRKFKREISIDVKNIFSGSPGSALIYKKRREKGNLISVTYSDFARYQIVTAGRLSSTKLDQKSVAGTNFQNLLFDNESFNISLLAGRERVHYFGKYNLYYGFDAGITGEYAKGWGYNVSLINDQEYYFYYNVPTKVSGVGPTVVPFFGMKYRINERISISAESGFSLRYLFQRFTLYTDQTLEETYASGTQHVFEHRFQPLRFLTLNYHFKQY